MPAALASCGVDIGGTFTDAVVTDVEGRAYSGKSPTTRGRLTEGFFAAVAVACEKAGYTLDEALRQLPYLAHGTTVATNIMVQRNGARVALLTTRGHGDAIFIQRAAGRVAGLPMADLIDFHLGVKPEPLIPRGRVFEVNERVDADGDVVVALADDDVRRAAEAALEAGADAIAVSYLWGFRNPEHEQRTRAIVEEVAPGRFASYAHEVAPSWGEYERTMTTAINCYVGPDTASYVAQLEEDLAARGFRGRFSVMKSSGGVASAGEASRLPVTLLSSGPAGALAGSQRLLEVLGGDANAITTDMGGTSFDIGLLVDGRPQTVDKSVVGRFEFHLPTIDIASIGSGGGSIAWVDELSGTLKVGPRSAGAEPGPAAYGRGGTEATVTDADIVLGYINPEYFLGGRLALDPALAEAAVGRVADALGVSTLEAAAGIRTIVDAAMADAIRMMTISRGYDPRAFSVLAFGGAGPLHAADYARELEAQRVIVPLADVSSLWSAMGVALADVVHVEERVQIIGEPFDAAELDAAASELEAATRDVVVAQGVPAGDVSLSVAAKMKYKLQVHTVDIPLLRPDDGGEALVERFEARYRELYGAGSGYRGAGIEITGLQCTAVGHREQAVRLPLPGRSNGTAPPPPETRDVYWTEAGERLPSRVFRAAHLTDGWSTQGPAVLELPDTTVAIPPDFRCELDATGNLHLIRDPQRGDA